MYIERVIPVDHGNRNCKTMNCVFTSGLQESLSKPAFGDYLWYNGKYYYLSEQRIPYMRDKTADERFFILTLFAIGMELDREKDLPKDMVVMVKLPVGLPPKHYGKLYREFEKYLKCMDIVEFSFRKKQYKVSIQDVVAYPQSYAASLTIHKKIANQSKVTIIDIGGYTLDPLVLRDGKPDLSMCESLEFGVIKMYNNIKSLINAEYDVLLEENDIDDIIRGKASYFTNDLEKDVRASAQVFVHDMLGSLRERGYDLKVGCVVFVGGGSLLLEKYIRESGMIGDGIFLQDLSANAKGYEILYHLSKGR